jgi:tetratricopeptide (TPR) repeat protein
VFTRNREAGEKAAALLTDRRRFTPEVWTTGHSMRAYSLVSRGHLREALAEVDSVATYDAFSARQLEAWLYLVPAIPADRSVLERLLSEIVALDPTTVIPSGNPSFFYNVLEQRHEIIQLYLAGALSARLGDAEAARAYAERLEAAERPPEGGSVTFDLAAGLRSMAARAEGHPERALAALDEIRMDIFYQMAMASPYDGLVLERFERGTLLQDLGRYDEAVGWFENLGSVGAAEVAMEPGAALHLAQVYESMGEPALAAEQYGRFVEMWRDADSELQPIVEEARANLRRLVPDGGAAE